MNVVVLGGGNSPERAVSLRSARAIAGALKKSGYQVLEFDPSEGIDSVIGKIPPNSIVFPILHGGGGEDGSLQATLESNKIAFLGSGSLASFLCFDKWITRQLLSNAGLPIAKGELVTKDTFYCSQLAKRPHVLKVARGGSSIGTVIVRDTDKVSDSHYKEVFKLNKYAVIEELIDGIEVTVPILDRKALPVIEIRPPEEGEFDYENKYNGRTAEICPPQSINRHIQKTLQELSEKAHKVMNCRHLSRVDLIIKPNNEVVILEINTIPGLTDQSLYPKSANVAGYNMPKLAEKFVQMVVYDYNL